MTRIRTIFAAAIPAAALSIAGPAAAGCPETAPLMPDARIAFAPGSAAPGAEAETEIAALAARAAMLGAGTVCVYGHSTGQNEGDPGGALAIERAETIAAALRQAGVPGSRIEVVEAPPADRLFSALGAAEAASRVDVVIEP